MDRDELSGLYVQTLVSVEDETGALVPVEKSSWTKALIHILTAWNPGEERPTREENDAANDLLHRDLVRRGLLPRRAVGQDPHSEHFEESWAVTGLDDHEARAIGASFGQVAVFRIFDGMQTVLACAEDWMLSRAL